MTAEPTIAARMRRVETNLIPFYARHGDGTPAATLAERMAHYGVPGVSIALIDGRKIAYAQWREMHLTPCPPSVTRRGRGNPITAHRPLLTSMVLRDVEFELPSRFGRGGGG
jgi:hypothetical protein